MDTTEFKKSIKRVSEHRERKVTNSYGGKDAYKWYRENISEDPKEAVTLVQYLKIIRETNNRLREYIANGEDIKFPAEMGALELKKIKSYVGFKDGKLKTNLLIDWDKTLDLWAEDEESRLNKQLVRYVDKYRFKVIYNKEKAKYVNKSYYQFGVNRGLKMLLRNNIRDNKIDAFLGEQYYDRENDIN